MEQRFFGEIERALDRQCFVWSVPGVAATFQQNQLSLPRCPHCNVDKPLLGKRWTEVTGDYTGTRKRTWVTYVCSSCGGVVLTATPGEGQPVSITEMYPQSRSVADEIPARARELIMQCQASLHAPAGAVVLAAAAVDSMLKAKGKVNGTLYKRIDEAAADHTITSEMAAWAHNVRLDANDQRHADENVALPGHEDATLALDFTIALAEYLFVLPARVTRGRAESSPGKVGPT